MSEAAVTETTGTGGDVIRCDACPVLCRIRTGQAGACDRYMNDAGRLKRVDALLVTQVKPSSMGAAQIPLSGMPRSSPAPAPVRKTRRFTRSRAKSKAVRRSSGSVMRKIFRRAASRA